MRAFGVAVGLLSVSVMAQTAPIFETAPPPPVPISVTLQGADGKVFVSAYSLRTMAVAEPDIAAPDAAPREGVVSLLVRVSRGGEVMEAVPTQGDEALRQASVEGVTSGWKYHPLMVNGQPQEFQSTIQLAFRDGVGKRAVASLGGIGVAGMAGPGVAQTPMDTHGAVRVSSAVVAGLMTNAAAPVYPPIAKAAHVQGVVVMHAILSKTGDVENLQVISGPPMLTAAAMDAVRRWKYKPYLLNGEPVEVDTTINVNFVIPEPPKAPAEGAPDAK